MLVRRRWAPDISRDTPTDSTNVSAGLYQETGRVALSGIISTDLAPGETRAPRGGRSMEDELW